MSRKRESRNGVEILHRPLYSIAEAATYLRLPSSTLRRWLEGTRVEGIFYPPVLREEPHGGDELSWAEFVEAGFLREYRAKGVALQNMRPFIERAREAWGVPYPLAHFKPLIENRRLVYDLQRETELDEALYLVRVDAGGDRLQLAPPVQSFLEKVEFTPDGMVGRIRPMGKQAPLVIDPEVSFGIPQIRGVRAENVAETVAATGDAAAAAEDWGLDPAEIEVAVEWQASLAA